MNETEIITKVKEYYEKEFNYLIKLLNSDFCEKAEMEKRDLILRTRAGFFHISMFMQNFDVDYDAISKIYNEYYYDKFYNLLLTY